MENMYNMVKSWYDDGMIGHIEWQEFCALMLEYLMEQNQDVFKRLKNI